MREEYVKNHFKIGETTVYESPDEFIFSAKNEKGEDIEHHIAKIDPFVMKIDNEKKEYFLKDVLDASVAFPNLPTSKALEMSGKVPKKSHGK